MAADAGQLRTLERVAVLGAGTMGAGIVQIAAEAGVPVMVHDPVPGAVDRARERISRFLARRVEKGEMSAQDRESAMGCIQAAQRVEELAGSDLVVEAIPEDLELKREAFRLLDAASAPSTVLASNTSSLSIARIASATQRP